MKITAQQPNALSTLENWLNILINTYCQHPSKALAKVIDYYIERILYQHDINTQPLLRCQYLSMKKYWYWQSY